MSEEQNGYVVDGDDLIDLRDGLATIACQQRAADEIERLRAELDALREQQPAGPCYYDYQNRLVMRPCYAAPVAQQVTIKSHERIVKEVAFFREQIAKNNVDTPYGQGIPAPWSFLDFACTYLDQLLAAAQAQEEPK